MKSVRLLPIVIFAIAALLIFKTIGLVTNGGYVLGPAGVQAAEGGSAAPAASGAAPAEGADAGVTMASEPTLADTNPTIADTAPTLATEEAAKGAPHGAAPAAEGAAAGGEAAAAPAEGHAAPADGAAATADAAACPPTGGATTPAAAAVATEGDHPTADASADAAAADHTADPAAVPTESFAAGMTDNNCDPKAEGVPMEITDGGTVVPLTDSDGGSLTEKILLERLAQRRTELDSYASQLDLRQSLVDAAEKRIDERAATLKQMQDQIGVLVDQKKDAETGQFAAIVTMYENMKPKEAAAIFNNLDMGVLLRVAQAMNPRKMAPVLAAMTSTRAQDLTVQMATSAATPAETMTPQDLSALPQIVGQ
ncbi:hypothetical protein [Devosia sp.]|uniref:MotE family protein n=1 Tax=Devosia sp. TaxID=1871048 RepID=UPI0032673A7C